MPHFAKLNQKETIYSCTDSAAGNLVATYVITAEINEKYLLRAESKTTNNEVSRYSLIRKSDGARSCEEGTFEITYLAKRYDAECKRILNQLPNKTYHIQYSKCTGMSFDLSIYRHYTNHNWELSPIIKIQVRDDYYRSIVFTGEPISKVKAKGTLRHFLNVEDTCRINVDFETTDLQEDYDEDGTIFSALYGMMDGYHSLYVASAYMGSSITKEEGDRLSLEEYKSARREHYFTLPPTSVVNILEGIVVIGVIPIIGYEVTLVTETNDQKGCGVISETSASTGECHYRNRGHGNNHVTPDMFDIMLQTLGCKEHYIHIPAVIYKIGSEVLGIIDIDILTDNQHSTSSLIRVVCDQHLSLDLLEFPDWITEIVDKDIDVALTDYKREHSTAGVLDQLNIKM